MELPNGKLRMAGAYLDGTEFAGVSLFFEFRLDAS